MARARKKLSRKDLVQQDEITNRLEHAAVWVVDHPRPFLWGIAGIIVVVIAATGWSLYARSRSEGAQMALGSVIRTYHNLAAYESEEARFQATLNEVALVEENYGGTQSARIARYYAALAHEGLGEIDDAVRMLEELGASGDASIRPIARFALGQVYKHQGQLEQAISVYRELLDSGEYAGDAVVFELAALHEASGSLDEAGTWYETLLADYPGSAYEPEAERALKRLATATPVAG